MTDLRRRPACSGRWSRDNPRCRAKALASTCSSTWPGDRWWRCGSSSSSTVPPPAIDGARERPALGLAGSLALQGTASVGTAMMFGDLHESSARVLTGDIMRLTSTTPGIEHHERPEYADRIALFGAGAPAHQLRQHLRIEVALVVRIALTIVLLASVHPALLAMPLLAVPSIWTGRRANRIGERTKGGDGGTGAYPGAPLEGDDHARPGQGGAGQRPRRHLVERHRRLWDEVADGRGRAVLRVGTGSGRRAGRASPPATWAPSSWSSPRPSRARRHAGDVCSSSPSPATSTARWPGPPGWPATPSGPSSPGRLQWLSDYADAARRPPDEPAPVPDRLTDGIAFEGVTFRYPGTGTECWPTSTCGSRRARWSLSWAPTGPASRRWSSCSPAATSRRRDASPSTGSTSDVDVESGDVICRPASRTSSASRRSSAVGRDR